MSQRQKPVQQSGKHFGAQTEREAKVQAYQLQGMSKYKALRLAGFSHSIARSPSKIETPEMREELEQMRCTLVERVLDEGLADALEIHEQLSEHLRGDIADLYDESGELLPVKDWPMWARTGGVEVIDEPNMVHSDDDGGGSWDQKGRKQRIRIVPRHKTQELLMKHKGVNAMVQAPAAQILAVKADSITVQLAQLLTPEQLEAARAAAALLEEG